MGAQDSESTASFRIGFKNILGANWARRKAPWRQRESAFERELVGPAGMNASAYFFVEVDFRAQRMSLARMLPGWDTVRTRGRNDAYSDPAIHRLVSRREIPLGSTTWQRRKVTIVDYEHLESGIGWTAAVTHLSSSGYRSAEDAAASRSAEATNLVRLCARHSVDIIAADLNNSVTEPGTPRGQLQSAGYRDWRSETEVENVEFNTFHLMGVPLPRESKHLDAFYVGPRVTVLSGRVAVDEPTSSDHRGLVTTISVSADG